MNLAIAITATNYKPPLIDLPACDFDANLIAAILEGATGFDDKLIIRNIRESAVIKKKLTEFIAQHKEDDVEQVFFYFSGHGDFTGDAFFHLLPDYEEKLRRQTSLEDSELDSLLRSLKPKLAIKVIDACHSGQTYIKDTDAFQTYINGKKEEFDKCYFMFSSHADQASYQNEEFSFFTRSFAEAIAKHSTDSIRFKDIIDYVSDAFSGNSRQKPFFVTQADFTEPFCQITNALRESLADLLSGSTPEPQSPAAGLPPVPLAQLVEREAQQYCTQEQAAEILERMAETVSQAARAGDTFQLFDVQCSQIDDYSEVPHIGPIVRWVDKWVIKGEHKLFVDVGKSMFATDVDLLSPSTSLPYCHLRVCAVPKYPNLNATVCDIIPLVSEKDLRLFFAFGTYQKKGWTERRLEGRVDWQTIGLKLRDEDAIRKWLEQVLDDFWNYTLTPIKKRLGLIKDEGEGSEDEGETHQAGAEQGEEAPGTQNPPAAEGEKSPEQGQPAE